MQLTDTEIKAVRDYAFLLGKGYPDKRSLELVADRYHLDNRGRALLFRGVFKKEVNGRHRKKVLPGEPPPGSLLRVDVLNQLYTLVSYLSGKLVYVASDGMLRDVSGFFGKPVEGKVLRQSVQHLFAFLLEKQFSKVTFYLDAQASAASSVNKELNRACLASGPDLEIVESEEVDALLTSEEGCLLATSDTTIIGRCKCTIYDLARQVLEQHFSGKIPQIAEVLSEIE